MSLASKFLNTFVITLAPARSNAFAVDWNGLIYVGNASTGVNVSQLQSIINSSNKLSADLIFDGTINAIVTQSEKSIWNVHS